MNILYLGYAQMNRVVQHIGKNDPVYVLPEGYKLTSAFIEQRKIDWIVSYGYRSIIKRAELEAVHGKAINLHISMLPWNRGAHPNIWSFVDNTPSGVTIHQIDKGIDTGDIYAQRSVEYHESDTLSRTYWRLRDTIETLFVESWEGIRDGKITAKPQAGNGSFHRMSELERLRPALVNGYDTTIAELRSGMMNA